MNISLTSEFENFINKKVESGLYHSASEVIREALRLLKEQEEIKKYRLEELKRDIAIGIRQEEHGEIASLNMDAIKAKVKQQMAQRRTST